MFGASLSFHQKPRFSFVSPCRIKVAIINFIKTASVVYFRVGLPFMRSFSGFTVPLSSMYLR